MRSLFLILSIIFSLSGKELQLTSEDGFTLYGWLEYPKAEKDTYPIAFFAHQFGSDHTIWDAFAKELRQEGFATLLVDLRGHGKSTLQNAQENKIVEDVRLDHIAEAYAQSDKKVGFAKIPSDVGIWLDQLGEIENLDMQKLVMFGSSLGGGAILPLMVDYEPAAVISISPGSAEKESLATALEYSESPLLLIAAKDDPLQAQTRALEYANQSLRGTYLMISGDGHGTVLLPRVEVYIKAFLFQYIH